jgi:type VI secretion system protein ImpH
MAGKSRNQTYALKLTCLENPVGLSFFQTVRRVECLFPDLPRIGHALRSSDEPVQFCQAPSLIFSPATLQGYVPPGDNSKPRLMVNFMGLLGPQGPMPLHITDYVHDREHNHDDPTLARFLDIFNHRMISLFYRAWACNRQTISYDRPQEDRFAAYIGSLFGMGTKLFRFRDHVPDQAKLHFSGFLTCQTRHAEGLRAILTDFFGIKTVIKEFVGQLILIPENCRCRLGETTDTATLGVNTVVGSQAWDFQQKFRIVLGPMTLKKYEQMLPGGTRYKILRDWVRNYVGDALKWELQLILKAAEVPEIRLGKSGCLGWTTWLRTTPFETDVKDLKIQAAAA